MRKLISFLMAVLIALPLYSKDPEYISVGKQFNTVVINVPASISIESSPEHSISITNHSNEFYRYELSNDTLFIKSKYQSNLLDMAPNCLEVKLRHPKPTRLFQNIRISGRALNFKDKGKSGNQK